MHAKGSSPSHHKRKSDRTSYSYRCFAHNELPYILIIPELLLIPPVAKHTLTTPPARAALLRAHPSPQGQPAELSTQWRVEGHGEWPWTVLSPGAGAQGGRTHRRPLCMRWWNKALCCQNPSSPLTHLRIRQHFNPPVSLTSADQDTTLTLLFPDACRSHTLTLLSLWHTCRSYNTLTLLFTDQPAD